MILAAIFSSIVGSTTRIAYEKYVMDKIPGLKKLVDNSKEINDKLVKLILTTINESLEKFNLKYNGQYLDFFKNDKNFTLILESFDYNKPILNADLFDYSGFGYNKSDLSNAIKDFIALLNEETSKVNVLSEIAAIKEHIGEGTETKMLVKAIIQILKEINKKLEFYNDRVIKYDDEADELSIISFNRDGMKKEDYKNLLDMTDLFYGNCRYINDDSMWEGEVKTRLLKYLSDENIKYNKSYNLTLDANVTIAFMIGRLLDFKRGTNLNIVQKGSGKDKIWKLLASKDSKDF